MTIFALLSLFQFHTGSIKSIGYVEGYRTGAKKFQFHTGSIKSLKRKVNKEWTS